MPFVIAAANRPAAQRSTSAAAARVAHEAATAVRVQSNLHRRVNSAKATVDTRPPAAYTLAPQRADRRRRQQTPQRKAHATQPRAPDPLLQTQRLESESPGSHHSSDLDDGTLELRGSTPDSAHRGELARSQDSAAGFAATARFDDIVTSATPNVSVEDTARPVPAATAAAPSFGMATSAWSGGALGTMLGSAARTAALGGSNEAPVLGGSGRWRQLVQRKAVQDDPELRLMSFAEDVTQDIVWQAAHTDG